MIDPSNSCIDNTECPGRPAGILARGVVIELKNFYTLADLEGEPDSFIVYECYSERGTEETREFKPKGCRAKTSYPTGEAAFLVALNTLVAGIDSVPKIKTLQDLKFRKCECAEEIFLMEFPEDLWNDIDVENRVASGTSKTREENEGNGIIASIGLNPDLSPSMDYYDSSLAGFRVPLPDTCGLRLDPDKYDPKGEKMEFGKNREALMAKLNAFADREAERRKCTAEVEIDLGVAPNHPGVPGMVTVAVIDTGVDPFYNYGDQQNNPVMMNDYFAFTPEIDALGFSEVSLTFSYGDSLAHDGIDANGNCLPGDYYGWDYYSEDNNPADQNGHGTHVASTILSANDAVDHPIRIVPLQFGDQENGTFSGDLFSAICALNYATERGVDIINMSWGYSSPDTNQVLKEQIIAAHDAGILMVASAGNEGHNVDGCFHWPSNFSTDPVLGDQFISVAALDSTVIGQSLQLASYSNSGQSIDLAAPGTDVEGALLHSGTGVVRLSGTSMAAAFVSRRAAMVKQLPNGTRLTAPEIKALILSETTSDSTVCIAGGRLYDPVNDPSLDL